MIALSINNDYADAYNNLGIALQDQGKLDKAREAFTKALSINPSLPRRINLSSIKKYKIEMLI